MHKCNCVSHSTTFSAGHKSFLLLCIDEMQEINGANFSWSCTFFPDICMNIYAMVTAVKALLLT